MVMLVASSRAAWAALPEGEARPLRVKIDVSTIAEADAPHIERFTNERIEPLLRDRSFAKADDAGDAVEIRIEYIDPKDLEYAIYLDVFDDGTRIDPGVPWFVCKFCPQGMVADKVAENLPAALDLLERTEATAEDQGKGEPASPIGEPPTVTDEPAKPVRPIGWMGITGAIVAGGGLATTIAGAVRLAQGEVAEPSQASQQRVEDYRPQGRVLLGVGVSALAMGTAALVVDVVLRKKKRDAVAVTPTWSPHGAGLALSGRF
ncbi:hypothetical protein [Paraliomyxa miuraensis]|uniref:hypothetical protein n=1 Tax=Paraliomyxa miuraensis TaxID=376150 RepID=UPI0022500E35|nr:hypothetical protein [Paraliomyxa miuraensis]MCX4239733.1 hypothetical protein [Paraliomyxa miuraensis]